LKPLNIFLLVVVIASQYALWLGDKNFFDLYKLNLASAELKQENRLLYQRNQKLIAEVNDLKQGGETVETIARSELGLIKKEETFYQIVE